MIATLILKRLKEMGLSSYEAKTYLSLLERDILTVTEVSRLAGIPRPNAYDALEKLMSKGMCISKPGDKKMFSASDPALLKEKFLMKANQTTQIELENLKEKKKEIIEKSKAALEIELRNFNKSEKEIMGKNEAKRENIGIMIKELEPQFEKSRLNANPLDYIEIIRHPFQMHKRFMQLVREAEKEILAFVRPPYSGPQKKLEEQVNEQIEPLQQGTTIRGIYEIPKDKKEIEWWLKSMDIAIKHGEETRTIKELPMKMAIFDEKVVMLTLEDPVYKQTSLTSQIVEHCALAKSLKMLFETLWEQAEDYHISKP